MTKYIKLLLFIIMLQFFGANGCTSTKVDQDEIKKANQFFESVFQDRVLDSPEFQSRLGYKSNYDQWDNCLLYTSPSPRDATLSRMPSSA